MAEYCKECLLKFMGVDPNQNPEWLVDDGGICEGCGYEYLDGVDDASD
jgi:hypothetical protein